MNPTERQNFEQRCHDYYDGLMSPAEQAQFLQQLNQKAEYKAIFDNYVQVHQQLQQFPLADPPAELEARILTALQSESHKPSRLKSPHFQWKAAAVLLIGLAIGTLSYVALSPREPGPFIAETHHPPKPSPTAPKQNTAASSSLQERDLVLAEHMETLWQDIDTLYEDQAPLLEETDWSSQGAIW